MAFTAPIMRACVCTCHLWYDYVGQGAGQAEELQRVLQAQRGVMLRVILHTVVDVGDLADVVAAALLHVEVPLQLGPALQHQLQGLAMVQLEVCGRVGGNKRTMSILM